MLTLTGLLLFFFPDKLVGIFSADAAVIALGALCLKIESLHSPSPPPEPLWPGRFGDPATPNGRSISAF